jgi:ribonuclease BN (tRNA processing enzyme)
VLHGRSESDRSTARKGSDGGAPSNLSLRVLGCDGSWPGPGGAGSGYLVSSGGSHVVLDLGPGTFANLQLHVDPALVAAVVISHRHPDHWSDLYSLTSHARFALGRESIPVYAPGELGTRTGLAGSSTLDWHPVSDGDSVAIGALSLSFHRTDHGVETLAVRINGGGRALGYSADTGTRWSLTELGTDLDLALCEASYTVEHEGTAGHMSGRQAGEQAARAGARRLVLTHRWPTIAASAVAAEAEATFGMPVEQAAIGKEFVL